MENKIKIKVEAVGIDETIDRVKELNSLLKQTKKLCEEIESKSEQNHNSVTHEEQPSEDEFFDGLGKLIMQFGTEEEIEAYKQNLDDVKVEFKERLLND